VKRYMSYVGLFFSQKIILFLSFLLLELGLSKGLTELLGGGGKQEKTPLQESFLASNYYSLGGLWSIIF